MVTVRFWIDEKPGVTHSVEVHSVRDDRVQNVVRMVCRDGHVTFINSHGLPHSTRVQRGGSYGHRWQRWCKLIQELIQLDYLPGSALGPLLAHEMTRQKVFEDVEAANNALQSAKRLGLVLSRGQRTIITTAKRLGKRFDRNKDH